MRVFKDFEVVKRECVEIICNKCEKHMKPYESEYFHFSFQCGYWSELFGDMTEVDFDLCEECMFDITREFKIARGERNPLEDPLR